MAQQSNVDININSQLDGKGFKQTDKAVDKLTKSVKNLAKTFGPAILGAAIVKFGVDAAKAFIDDQQQAAKLAQVVKNLGLEFENPAIASYIDKLTIASGVTDTKLRPAFQALLSTTGSVTKSQELLNLAIETSRGSTIDLEQVAQDLSNAYVGKTKALAKYNLGLTAAELKTAKFVDIQKKLNDLYQGSSAAYLETYAGKLLVLKNAAREGQEIIGGALIQSLMDFTGALDVADLATKIGGWSKSLAAFIDDFTFAFKKLYFITSDRALLESLNPFSNYVKDGYARIDAERVAGELRRALAGMNPFEPNNNGVTGYKADAAAKAKAEADAKKRAKDLAALTTKNTAELKKQNALKKDSAVFDQQHIELVAALKNNLSEDERNRVKLQLTLLEGNVSEADKLAKLVLTATDDTGKLYAYFKQTPEAKNPFGYLDQWVIDFQSKLDKLKLPVMTMSVVGNPNGLYPSGVPYDPRNGNTPDSNVPSTGLTIPDTGSNGFSGSGSGGSSAVEIKITGDGALTNAIAGAMQNASLSSGQITYLNRRTGGFE